MFYSLKCRWRCTILKHCHFQSFLKLWIVMNTIMINGIENYLFKARAIASENRYIWNIRLLIIILSSNMKLISVFLVIVISCKFISSINWTEILNYFYIQVSYVYGGGDAFIEPQVPSSMTPPPNCVLNQDGDFWSPNKECSSDCINGFVKQEFPDFCCCYYIEE